jgi:hypothetical protein
MPSRCSAHLGCSPGSDGQFSSPSQDLRSRPNAAACIRIPYGSAPIGISEPLRSRRQELSSADRVARDDAGFTPDQDHGLRFRGAGRRVSCWPQPCAFAPRSGRGGASGVWFFCRESTAGVALSRYCRRRTRHAPARTGAHFSTITSRTKCSDRRRRRPASSHPLSRRLFSLAGRIRGAPGTSAAVATRRGDRRRSPAGPAKRVAELADQSLATGYWVGAATWSKQRQRSTGNG